MKNFTLKNTLYTLSGCLLGALALFLVLASAKSDKERRCIGLKINIKDNSEQLLVKSTDVENWATLNGQQPFDGKVISSIDLQSLEKQIKKNEIIKECEAYIDLKGNLILDVEVHTPIARIVAHRAMEDKYMDKDGHFFPVSKNFTPTVMLLSGSFFSKANHLKSEKNKDLLEFINTITNDPFWNAQITFLEVNQNKEIQMVPLLGNNVIEFGKPVNIKTKLEKLMLFYKKILPQDKWKDFSHVSVKYDGQIVCK